MVYAVSDLHGQYDLFLRGLSKIGFSDGDYLYVVGDAIDRGPNGVRLLEHIRKSGNMDLILGNHEYMMLRGLFGNRDDKDLWVNWNGGRTTLVEFNSLEKEDQVELYDWLRDRYVSKVVLVDGKGFCLVHSSFTPSVKNKRFSELSERDSEVYCAVWSSPYRRDYGTRIPFTFDKHPFTFITGHVPVQRIVKSSVVSPYRDRNLVNIDGGCAYGDFEDIEHGAIFYCLDNGEYRFVPMEIAEG